MTDIINPYGNGPDSDEETDLDDIPDEFGHLWYEALVAQNPALGTGAPISKHQAGAHDQKTHGRRGGGSTSQVAEKSREAIVTQGGFSMRMGSGIVPRTGYMVARGMKSDEADLGHVDNLQAKDIAGYIDKHKVDLSKPSRYFGGWVDERGHVLLDISERTMDRAKAIRLGRERGQDAIFDLNTMEDIITKAMGRAGSGLPVRFWLDHRQPPDLLVAEIKGFAQEAMSR